MELNHHLPVYKTGLYRFKLTVQKVWWVRRPFSLLGALLARRDLRTVLARFPVRCSLMDELTHLKLELGCYDSRLHALAIRMSV